MVARNPQDRNYWHLLAAAREALAAGDFATAERRFLAADERRQASPGRVFFSERLGDGLARLVRRGSREKMESPGRWERQSSDFRATFMQVGEGQVREAVRLAELRPEDNAEANQPILAGALFLVANSRLFPAEPESAAILLKGLIRTAHRTGRVFPMDLLRHDLPLPAEDRLWLARKGVAMLEVFLDQGSFAPGTVQAGEWTEAVLRLLHPEYFGQGERLDEERAWLEARSADRLLGRATESVVLYRDYLRLRPEPSPRADEARVRLLELQANIDDRHFPVPCYDAALAALSSAGLAPGSEAAGRYEAAVGCLEYRRPEAASGAENRAWATAALTPAGEVALVFWWGNAPRDLAFWRPGDDVSRLEAFLAPCAGRVAAANPETVAAVAAAWSEDPCAWAVTDYAAVLAGPLALPRGTAGVDLERAGSGVAGTWRADWRRDLGLAALAPGEDGGAHHPECGPALQAGLTLIAMRTRISEVDPALRAGMGEMARRGDPACRFLYGFLVLGDEAARAVDSAFEPWTLPLLWTRPFPDPPAAVPAPAPADEVRPDLARNPLAIVTTGRPAPVLAAWCGGQHRWRVVLDRLDRLPGLLSVAGLAGGPLTVVPPGGTVHELGAALGLLEDLLPGGGAAGDAGLLPLCHWLRLVTSHNGDLLDDEMLRSRTPGACEVLDRYAGIVGGLPRTKPGTPGAPWAEQFAQRVRRAGCVLGLADDLPGDSAQLDAAWGVFEGSGASWVFLDAAAIRSSLGPQNGAAAMERHALLHPRGERHLALLTGAVWCRNDVEDLLAEEAAVFGPATVLALTDLRSPPLVLADRGIVAEARVLRADALAAAVEYLDRAVADGRPRLVRLPKTGLHAEFWRETARSLPGAQEGWQVDGNMDPGAPGLEGTVLCLPVLPGLEEDATIPVGDTAEDWRQSDELRRLALVASRRRAGLELAAHLAGRWDAVEVLDTRWWHLGRPAAALAGRAWTGERAASVMAPTGARCIDLPGGGGRESSPPGPRVAAVRAWCDARRDAAAVEPASTEIHGLRLEIGYSDLTARGLLAAVQAGREAGDLDRWLLVVANRPWPVPGTVTAGCSTPGATVWTPGREAQAPGPMLWARPADLLDPAFQVLLADMPPAAAVVPDLEEWLPEGSVGAHTAASALRELLKVRPPAVLLQATALHRAWSRFLVAAAGVDVVAAEADQSPAADDGDVTAISPATLVLRLRRLLRRLRPLLEQRAVEGGGEGPRHLVSARELVALDRLGCLTGLPPQAVRDGIRVLRWGASLAGENLSTADAQPEPQAPGRAPGHALLIRRRFAECEAGLDELAAQLELFLPLWLGDVPAGGATWIDLAAPPAQIEPAALRRLDTFLLAAGADLTYTAPRGTLGSTRRWLRLHRSAADTLTDVMVQLDKFRGRLREVMGTAVETADGFLVETGLATLRDEEQAFLGLGAALDEWRWLGPVSDGAVHTVDLLTLADSATAVGGGDAWSLVGDLYGEASPATADEARSAPKRPGWRSLLPGGERGRDVLAEARSRVTDLAASAAEPTQLVLRGLAGSGRLKTLLGGLAAARKEGADPGDVVVCCPDTGTAARVARGAVAAGLLLDLRVPGREELPPPVPDEILGDVARNDVVVMCEAQRFPAELRYRVAQFGRGRRLLMTVDPAAAREPWENLFLTTPRADDVLELATQTIQSRRLWADTRALVPERFQPATGTRRDVKGQVTAEYAANLDQCLSRLRTALKEGLLPGRFRLTAPLVEDLEHLRAALCDQGWHAVEEERCDSLCLPGPHEVLALAAATLEAAGLATTESAPADAEGEGGVEVTFAQEALNRLPGAGPGAAAWIEEQGLDPRSTTLAELQARAVAADVLPVLALPAARARSRELLGAWGERILAELPTEPLWVAWWRTLLADLGLPAPGGRPLVLLNPVERDPGARVPGGVYLCHGTEDRQQHYRVLAGVTDDLLVLYQERSPLPSAAAADESAGA